MLTRVVTFYWSANEIIFMFNITVSALDKKTAVDNSTEKILGSLLPFLESIATTQADKIVCIKE